jgi:hypothetical protein
VTTQPQPTDETETLPTEEAQEAPVPGPTLTSQYGVQVDPRGGIVDRDFVGRQTPATFQFAGANLGGQSVGVCSQCGALVQERWQDQHTTFHGIVNGTANRIGMQTG